MNVPRETGDPKNGAITLVLPYPISANRMWRIQVVKKGASSIPIPLQTSEGKAYKKHVGRLARDAGIEEPIVGPVEVHIALYPHRPLDWVKRAKADPTWWDLTVQRLDLDNARKVLYDALKDVAFGDDRLVLRDGGEVMIPDDLGERVVVTIRPYVREAVQPQLELVVPRRVLSAAEREKVPF